MEKLKVKIVNKSPNPLPCYETHSSAGMDVRAWLTRPMTLKPGERALIPTGLAIQLPEGFECQIRPRSGLALKYGVTILNAPGTVDADYRGDIGIIVINTSDEEFVINGGDRICQMVIKRYERVDWEPVDELDKTRRGEGGFGHTGLE